MKLFKLVHNVEFQDRDKVEQFIQPMEGFEELRQQLPTTPNLDNFRWSPLLNSQQEQYLFRQYNCLKFLANSSEKEFEDLSRQIFNIRDVLCLCNLRLIFNFVKKNRRMKRWNIDIEHQFAEGYVRILDSIERFNYALGYKFSTYASWALLRGSIHHKRMKDSLHIMHMPFYVINHKYDLPAKEERTPLEIRDEMKYIRKICRKARLTSRDTKIMIEALSLCAVEKRTLQDIGDEFGMTKERVRQIKEKSIEKIRLTYEQS